VIRNGFSTGLRKEVSQISNKALTALLGAVIVLFIIIVTVVLIAQHSTTTMPMIIDDQVLSASIQYSGSTIT